MTKLGSLGIALLVLAPACGGQSSAEPAVFGGQGAQVAGLNEKPLPAGAGSPDALGPCGKSSPPSDAQLIDDFEDGDDHAFKGFEREGYWFGASDKTEGSTLSPSSPFAAELLPAAEATKENRYAVHFTAAGQNNWGVVWGTALQWTKGGLKCPLNVSSFAGLRFRAKGPATMTVKLAVPEVTPKDQGGSCADRCYDAHGKLFILTDKWETYEIPWEKLQQGGWGTEARFTPERIVNVTFNVDVKSLPADFWVDDVELMPKVAKATH